MNMTDPELWSAYSEGRKDEAAEWIARSPWRRLWRWFSRLFFTPEFDAQMERMQ